MNIADQWSNGGDWTPRNTPLVWIAFIGALLFLIIVAITAWSVYDARDRAVRNGERELANTTLLLTRHIDHQFDDLLDDQKDVETLLGFGSMNSPLAGC